LFFTSGAPSVPPNWLRLRLSRSGAKKLRALKRQLRMNSNASP
jgi:hypothetical protein